MENREPRQDRAEKTLQAVISAAAATLAEGGLDSITHRSVAERANSSVRATTYYFKSVKALRREALKLAFALNQKQRDAIISGLASKKRSDALDLFLLMTYGKNLSAEALGTTLSTVLSASSKPEYADLIQEMQSAVESQVAKLFKHFGIELEATKAIALLDGRVTEFVLSGGKTDLRMKIKDDLGI